MTLLAMQKESKLVTISKCDQEYGGEDVIQKIKEQLVDNEAYFSTLSTTKICSVGHSNQ